MPEQTRSILGWVVLLAVMAGANQLAHLVGMGDIEPVDAVGNQFAPASEGVLGATAALGFLLLGAWLTGRIFIAVHLPKVSGYLLFGVLAGPQLFPAIAPEWDIPPFLTTEQLGNLSLINSLAIAFIALTAGGEIKVEFLRKGLKRIGVITGLEMSFVLIGVSLTMYLAAPIIGFMPDEERSTTAVLCLLIGTVAIANSPAVVMAMLSETGARGPMAQSSLTITILKDLALIILFTVVVAIATNMLSEATQDDGSMSIGEDSGLFVHLVWHLVGSIVLGVGVGVFMTFLVRKMSSFLPLFVIGSALAIALVSDAFNFESLLVALTAGFTMANLRPERSESFFDEMEGLALPVYCVFFAAAGAKIDIEALMTFWPVALAIVVVRLVMIVSGTWLGAKISGLEPPVRTWLWTALIPQAGVTVALITSLERTFGSYRWSLALSSLLLAVVAVHEIIGPLLMRLGLSRCGEVADDSEPQEEHDPHAVMDEK